MTNSPDVDNPSLGIHQVYDPVGATPDTVEPSGLTLEPLDLAKIKKDIHTRPHGAMVRKLRYYCDVLLR